MADVDIDPLGEHDKTDAQPDEPTSETIPFMIEGGSTWEPEQETSFKGTSQRMEVLKEHIKALYYVLSEHLGQIQKHFISMISKSDMENCTTETRANL